MLYTYYQKQTSGNNLSPRILVITELRGNPQLGVLTSWQAFFVQFYFSTWTRNLHVQLENSMSLGKWLCIDFNVFGHEIDQAEIIHKGLR